MRRRERVSLSFASWPILDRQLWEAAHVRGDFLEADGAAACWRDKTRHQVIKGYGLWLFHLAATTGLDPNALPHTRVTAPALCAFVESFASRATLSAVLPLLSFASTEAPAATRTFAISIFFRCTALNNGVAPSGARAFTSAPAATRASIVVEFGAACRADR